MYQNSQTSFLQDIQLLLYLSKCFALVYSTESPKTIKKKILSYISQACNLFSISLSLYWCFKSSKVILVLNYKNHTNVNTVSDLIHHVSVSCDTFFRYFIYFWNRKRFNNLLEEINELGEALEMDRSESPTLRKKITIFLIYVNTIIGLNLILIGLSSMQTSMELYSFYGLEFGILNVEVFLVKIILDEMRLLFSDINHKLKNLKDVDSFIFLPAIHQDLSRNILRNDDVINAGLLGTLLAFFTQMVNTMSVVVSNAKAGMEGRPIDPVLVGWNASVCLELFVFIWCLLKIRIDVVNEVSVLDFSLENWEVGINLTKDSNTLCLSPRIPEWLNTLMNIPLCSSTSCNLL